MKKAQAILYAPESYWTLPPDLKRALTNGCGPSGWLNKLVPDTMWGLVITPVCNIHDYQYAIGRTIEEKEEADRVFLNNLIRWIDANTTNGILRRLRYHRAYAYYQAVKLHGGVAYWAGKNLVGTMRLVTA